MFNLLGNKRKKEQKRQEEKQFIDDISTRLEQVRDELSHMKDDNPKIINELYEDSKRFLKMIVSEKFNRTSFSLEFEHFLKLLRSYRYDETLTFSEKCSTLINELSDINYKASNGIPGGLTRF